MFDKRAPRDSTRVLRIRNQQTGAVLCLGSKFRQRNIGRVGWRRAIWGAGQSVFVRRQHREFPVNFGTRSAENLSEPRRRPSLLHGRSHSKIAGLWRNQCTKYMESKIVCIRFGIVGESEAWTRSGRFVQTDGFRVLGELSGDLQWKQLLIFFPLQKSIYSYDGTSPEFFFVVSFSRCVEFGFATAPFNCVNFAAIRHLLELLNMSEYTFLIAAQRMPPPPWASSAWTGNWRDREPFCESPQESFNIVDQKVDADEHYAGGWGLFSKQNHKSNSQKQNHELFFWIIKKETSPKYEIAFFVISKQKIIKKTQQNRKKGRKGFVRGTHRTQSAVRKVKEVFEQRKSLYVTPRRQSKLR